MPAVAAEELHISKQLLKRIQSPGVELPVFLVRTTQLRTWISNQLDPARLKAMQKEIVENPAYGLENPLIVNLYFSSGLAVIFEGNHRVEVADTLNWPWLPVIFNLNDGRGHRNTVVQTNLDTVSTLNRIVNTRLQEFDPTKRPVYLFNSCTLNHDILAWVGIETLDPMAEHTLEMITETKLFSREPRATQLDFHREPLLREEEPETDQIEGVKKAPE